MFIGNRSIRAVHAKQTSRISVNTNLNSGDITWSTIRGLINTQLGLQNYKFRLKSIIIPLPLNNSTTQDYYENMFITVFGRKYDLIAIDSNNRNLIWKPVKGSYEDMWYNYQTDPGTGSTFDQFDNVFNNMNNVVEFTAGPSSSVGIMFTFDLIKIETES